VTDRRTDRHRVLAIAALMHSIVWQKSKNIKVIVSATLGILHHSVESLLCQG